MKNDASLPLGLTVTADKAAAPLQVKATRQHQKMMLSAEVSGIMSVIVSDSRGRKVSGLPVTFRLADASCGCLTCRSAVTNDVGWAHSMLLPTKPGNHAVVCEVGGQRLQFLCSVETPTATAKGATSGLSTPLKTPTPAEQSSPLPMFKLDGCAPIRPEDAATRAPMPSVVPAVLPNVTPPLGVPVLADGHPDCPPAKEELIELRSDRKALIALLVCLVIGVLIGIIGYRIFTARDIPAGETIDCRDSGWVDTGDKLVYKQCVVKRH